MTTTQQPSTEFAEAFRAAVEARGLSLDRLRYHMAVRGHELSVATLSYWGSGRSVPTRADSLAALGDLEEVLGLEPGALREKVPVRQRPRTSAGPPVEHMRGLIGLGEALDAHATALDLDWNDGLDRPLMYARLQVDAERRHVGHDLHTTVVARHDGIARVPHAFRYDNPDVPGILEVTRGGSIGRTICDEERNLLVAEVLLDRTLRRGESMMLSFRARESAPAPPVDEWEIGLVVPVRILHLEVDFAPGVVPRAIWRQHEANGRRRKDVVLPAAGHRVSTLIVDAALGSHGLQWQW